MFLVYVLAACSDYNLDRGTKDEGNPPPEDTGDPYVPPSDEPDIQVFPETLDFGSVLRDCPADPLDVTVTNVGLAELHVSDIVLDGDGATKFSLEGAGAVTLAYGESFTFRVGFTPTAWVTYDVEVDITSNDPDEGLVGVPASGTGAEDATYEEDFEQGYSPKIDVLWIVDNSGSMSESVGKVSKAFDQFMDIFLTMGLDYHLGVVTTDMDNPKQSGRLQGSPSYIDSTYGDPKGWFDATANQGFNGSGDEKGFDAGKTALTDPLKSAENSGFLRADTAVAVIVLSDENDSSGQSTTNFVSWFTGLRTDPADTTFNAIVGDSFLGCIGSGIEASGGDKYIDAADATDGLFVSICSSDYNTALTNLSQASAGLSLSFTLHETPSDVSRIVVEVDGTPVAYDPTDGYTYDSAGNTIDFHGGAVPPAGSGIHVEYPVSTGC